MRTTLSLPAHYSCEERKMSFVCRVCLGQERLHTLENDLLVDVYDKLSNTKFNSEDARPRALCCFCHDKLLTCHNFYEMTLVSEELFSQLLDKGLEATHENITDLNHAVKQHMPVTNKQIINDNTTNENTEVIIKWETISEKEEKTGSQLVQSEFVSGALVENEPITVKEELNTEVQLVQPEIQYVRPEVQLMKPDVQLVQPEQQEDKLVKNQSVSSADCTKSQLSLVKSINEKSVLVIKTNGEKRFGCTICYKQFTKKSGVVRHMVIHTGEKPYSCDVCDKRFNRKSILVEHKNIHTGIKLFTCNVCNKQFKNKGNLCHHMRIHTGEKPFACNMCDKKFIQKSHLVYHRQTHAVPDQMRSCPFSCDECKNKYTRKSSLLMHIMRIHTGEKPFTCNEREKHLSEKKHLIHHNMKTHSDKKSSVCDAELFNRKTNLIDHMKTHPVKRLFACNLCHMQFEYKSNLVGHMRNHTGYKPFACDLCDKKFNKKKYLLYHIRTHSDLNPFACNECDKQFIQKCHLADHMRTHSGEKPFSCKVCNKLFNRKSNVARHEKIHLFHAQFGAAVAAIQDALANEVSIPTSNGERVPIRAAVIAFSERCISNNNEGGNTANAGRCASTINPLECDEYSRGVVEKVDFIPLIPEPETLSVSAAKCDYTGVELIVGGEVATQGEFPHMAAIGWANFEGGYSFFCGGSLISPRFVLSAGHCLRFRDTSVQDPTPVTVRLGDQNIDPTVRDGADPTDVPIRRSYRHPDYKPPQTYNDIALFELQTDVQFNSGVRPACLWTRPDFGVHSKAIATGWGVTDSDPRSRKTSKELQKVSLSLLENEYCDDLLFDIRNRNWRGFEPSQMCAGELRGGKDTCQGDSGSPLQVASRENQCIFYVMGITSFGRRCAESGKPAVYTRVAAYLDWIEQTVWPGE